MKPRFAKAIVDSKVIVKDTFSPAGREISPVKQSLDFGSGTFFWAALRCIVEAIEECGFKVSITKDGKEYNPPEKKKGEVNHVAQ